MANLTIAKILQAMKTKHGLIASDGWCEISVISRTDHIGPMTYPSTYRVESNITFGVVQMCEGSAIHEMQKQAAHRIHREIYGDLIGRLSLLQHHVRNGTRDEAEKLLAKVLADLEPRK